MAEPKYWLHRISHEWDVSSWLLARGYLSIGWSALSATDIAENVHGHDDIQAFEAYMTNAGENGNRSRWNLWYFCNFKMGDIVLVPLYGGLFSIYKVTGDAMSVRTMPRLADKIVTESGAQIVVDDNRTFRRSASDEMVDIGFVLPVEPIKTNLSRYEYADNALTARMKMRQTNGDISDLAESILKAMAADAPVNLYFSIIEKLAGELLNAIKTQLTPDKFEKLVRWYFMKVGATNAYIDAKNKPGKTDGADADIIAEFDLLKVIIYAQAKLHDDTTSQWAVEQISKYKSQFDSQFSEYTSIPWVITTAERFSDDALTIAQNNHVRLIDGPEFARMLIDAGITNIDKAFE